MTKKIILTLALCTISYSPSLFSKNINPLIKCLGLEELAIHNKKVFGPVYKLNQLFINELATLYGLRIKEEALNKVCRNKSFSPSVNLLYELLIRGRSIFVTPKATKSGGVDALATSSLDGFLEKVPNIFLKYISQIQALTPKAKCLEDQIPEIEFFMEKYKYLEDIYGTRKIIESEKEKVKSIFSKLRKLDQIMKKCKKEKTSNQQ